jgi:magnesium chelatase subunit D
MPYTNGQSLPFPALVGLERVQQALLLMAIQPRLRGVILAAPAGTGKTSLARGLRDLLGAKTPFVELPSSVDAENLLGGADIEATLRTGRLVLQRGVLARAHGGFVYADGLNLLQDSVTNALLSVMDTGIVAVEREGISLRLPAEFSFIGTYDPAEGAPRQHLIDRIGLIVPMASQQTTEQRIRVLQHNLTRQHWGEETTFLRDILRAARTHVDHVTITDEQVEQLTLLALRCGVQGHRAELFAVYAACAAAAYELRPEVEFADLELAFRLTILPRATRMPEPETPPPPPEPPPPDPQEPDDDDSEDESAPPDDEMMQMPDQVLEALFTDLPDDLTHLPFMNLRRGRSGSRGTTTGKRGRHLRSIPGDPRRHRIDITATLRAAAPWQPLRHESNGHGGASRKIALEAGDLRVKQFRSKAGTLFCFAVDASGSMAIHRMRQAKGAVHALLKQAYIKRDKVALIAFRGARAELLMPPSQSVELAQRALDVLPTGGGTPLASALLLACDVAEAAKLRGIMQTVLILLTDGRGNVSHVQNADLKTEIQQLGRYVQSVGLRVMVVDTQRSYLSRGEARQLAEYVGGTYIYLPNASGENIAQAAYGLDQDNA